ncbi:MAG: hypothetical protein ACK50J_26125, partial [Planctomyces sp.]
MITAARTFGPKLHQGKHIDQFRQRLSLFSFSLGELPGFVLFIQQRTQASLQGRWHLKTLPILWKFKLYSNAAHVNSPMEISI